jgi:hypothetical protein
MESNRAAWAHGSPTAEALSAEVGNGEATLVADDVGLGRELRTAAAAPLAREAVSELPAVDDDDGSVINGFAGPPEGAGKAGVALAVGMGHLRLTATSACLALYAAPDGERKSAPASMKDW